MSGRSRRAWYATIPRPPGLNVHETVPCCRALDQDRQPGLSRLCPARAYRGGRAAPDEVVHRRDARLRGRRGRRPLPGDLPRAPPRRVVAPRPLCHARRSRADPLRPPPVRAAGEAREIPRALGRPDGPALAGGGRGDVRGVALRPVPTAAGRDDPSRSLGARLRARLPDRRRVRPGSAADHGPRDAPRAVQPLGTIPGREPGSISRRDADPEPPLSPAAGGRARPRGGAGMAGLGPGVGLPRALPAALLLLLDGGAAGDRWVSRDTRRGVVDRPGQEP